MIGDTLFDNKFFDRSLNTSAINSHDFVIKYFTNDSRITSDAHLYCFVGIKGENFDGNDFFEDTYKLGVRVFLLQKKPQNIPDDAIVYLVDDTLKAIGELAHQRKQELNIPHVLITGSVGKTTTRLMLTYILKQKYSVHTAQKNWNNAIGLPMTILATKDDAKISVLEAGMSSKGEISHLSKIVNPEIAVITNVGLSHVEFFKDKDEVAEAKIEIVDGMDKSSLLLINKHDPYRELFESKAKGQVKYFDPSDLSIVKDLGLEGFEYKHKDYDEVFFCPIAGEHLLLNLSIIFALIDVLQIPLDCIDEGLASIRGLGNRMSIFKNKKGVTIIADCYNASLESFRAALDVLQKAKGRKIAVVGSVLELGELTSEVHEEIGQYINQTKPDLVFATGQDIESLCTVLKVPYCHFYQKEDIWHALESELKSGDTVLVKASNGVGLGVIVDCLS